MRTMKINLVRVEPIGYENREAFIDGPGLHGYEPVRTPVYPTSPQGELLRQARLYKERSLRNAASAVGLRPSEYSGLESGRYTTDEAGWTELMAELQYTPRP